MSGIGPITGPGVAPWFLPSDLGISHAAHTVLGAANRGIIVPATLNVACTLTGIRVRVQVSSGNICVALFDSAFARLATSGSVACPATGTVASIAFTASYLARPGRYYMGVSADNNTVTISVTSVGPTQSVISAKYMETAFPLPDPFVSAGVTSNEVALAGVISGGWAP